MKPKFFPARTKGFTLIEMLVTITIIIILTGLSIGGYNFVLQKQARSQAAIQISLLSNALEDYKLDNGVYPPTGDSNSIYKALYWDTDGDNVGADTDTDQKIYVSQLDPLNNKQGWTEGTGVTATIRDPWNAEYIYINGADATATNPDFDIISKGKDGTTPSADDIRN